MCARGLAASKILRESVLVVPFEELCASPHDTIAGILEHVDLGDASAMIPELAARIAAPTYYQPDFSAEEIEMIAAETADTARAFGYD